LARAVFIVKFFVSSPEPVFRDLFVPVGMIRSQFYGNSPVDFIPKVLAKYLVRQYPPKI
jgi:hypothetical protein